MAGIYIHIPFCKTRCIYCDFYSTTRSELKSRYIHALCKELQMRKEYLRGEPVETIYFGGGTPSQLAEEDFREVFETIRKYYGMEHCREITLEANPDDLTEAYAAMLQNLPFNRISMGIQTFDDSTLKLLNRRHNAAQAVNAVKHCRHAGFNNISIDLIYGLPGETDERWKRDLQQAVSLNVEHISAYHLTYEEGTRIYELLQAHRIREVDEESSVRFFSTLIDTLGSAGYEHYEISNFAKPGFRSRHNLKYWTGGEYLGFGPCAASDFAGKRFTIEPDLRAYVEGIAHHGSVLSECETIPPRERAGEYVMLRSRIVSGLDAQEYERSYLLPFAPLQQLLERFAGHGLAAQSGSRWYLTPRGWLVSNRIILALQDAQEKSTPLAKKR